VLWRPVCCAAGADCVSHISLLAHTTYVTCPPQIYTYVGDILLAVNPYKTVAIYGKINQKLFQPTSSSTGLPHVFAIAQKAYKSVTNLRQNQCCLISGESGAGKTESAKYFLAQLLSFELGSTAKKLEEKIQQSQPILEAFVRQLCDVIFF
jgi:myosin-3